MIKLNNLNSYLKSVFLLALYVAVNFNAQSAQAEGPESRVYDNSFGKNYKGGFLQNWVLAQNQTQEKSSQDVLNLDTPTLEAKKEEGISAGPFTNLNFGGALDLRLYLPRPNGPTDEHMGIGSFDIHVAELFLTTNVGDNISILAEQLLVTSPMGSTVGQDHGFVYAIFSGLSWLPDSWAIKVGRMRFRYGIDAKLDSAANPLRTPVYQNLGIITDKGIEISGYSGSVDWSLGIANGVDMIMKEVVTSDGEMAEVEMETRNGSKPVIARVGWEPVEWAAVGLSGFSGKTYPVYSHYGFAMHDMIFNGHTDESKLIYKNRAAIDAKFKLGSRFDFSGEYSFGEDRDNGANYNVWSAYGRIDYRIKPQLLSAQLQYTYFDDGRDIALTEGMEYKDSGNIGMGLTYHTTDQSWIRAVFMMDDRGLFRSKGGDSKAPEYLGVIQTLISY